MKEFVDIYRSVGEKFNTFLDIEPSDTSWIIKKLQEFIKEDPYYFDPYTHLHNIYFELGNRSACEKVILEGYGRALELILNNNNVWPSRLRWMIVENRHIIRLFQMVGIWYWRNKKFDKSLDLFRKLLRSDPNDNIGSRHFILALRMNVEYEYFDEFFNKEGYYDGEIEEMFKQDYEKFPDEFDWWIKKIEKAR